MPCSQVQFPAGVVMVAVLVGASGAALPAPPAATQPATQPAGAALTARVTYVKGHVQAQVPGGEKWRAVKLGDVFGAGTRIRTMLRSAVIFVLSDTTVVKVEKATVMQITTAERTAEAENIRIGLEYGQVRAGVAERELRSDFTIDSPNATLARRGTQGISLFNERLTRRWEARLAGDGIMTVLDEVSGKSRTVYPAEYVTQLLTKMMRQKKLDWLVSIQPPEGLTALELAIGADQGNSGRGVVEPAASAQINTTVGTNLQTRLDTLAAEQRLPFNFVVTGGELFNAAGNIGFGGATPLNILLKGQHPFRTRAFAARRRSFRQVGRPRVRMR